MDVWFQVTMMKSVPNVIEAIGMIYSVSLYYNTSEKISALFSKVSVLYWVSENYKLLFRKSKEPIVFSVFWKKLQVTNQMVTACRSYISNNGTCLIWDQDAKEIVKKIQVMMILIKTQIAISMWLFSNSFIFYFWQDCICLYQEYRSCFQKAKKQILERPGKRSFEVSEMQIFCKFESFCNQLEKVKSHNLKISKLNCSYAKRPCQLTLFCIHCRSHK